MGLSGSLYSAVSGLTKLSDGMQTIGDNIANVSTIGYKKQDTTFSTVMSQQVGTATGTAQIGRGTQLSSIEEIFTIGSFETTSVSTHMAIAGEGFFSVKKSGEDALYYTRAGNFHLDKQQQFVTDSGEILQGYKILDTAGNLSSMQNVIIENFYSPPSKTTKVTAISNLADTVESTGAEVVGEKATLSNKYAVSSNSNTAVLASSLYKHTSVVAVYDEIGNKHDLTIYYDREQKWGNDTNDKWEFLVVQSASTDERAELNGAETYKGMLARGTLEFSQGKLVGMTMDAFTGRIGNVSTVGSINVDDVNFTINNSLVMQDDGYEFNLVYSKSGGWQFKKNSSGNNIVPSGYSKAVIVQGNNSPTSFSLNLDGDSNGVADLTVNLDEEARIDDEVTFDINRVAELSEQSFDILNTSSTDLGGATNLPQINTPTALNRDTTGVLERDFATDTWKFLNATQTEGKRSYYTDSSDTSTYLKVKQQGVVRDGEMKEVNSATNWGNTYVTPDTGTLQTDGTVASGYPKINRVTEFVHSSDDVNIVYNSTTKKWVFEQIQNVEPLNTSNAYKTALVSGNSYTNTSKISVDTSKFTTTATNMKATWNATSNRWELPETSTYTNALINRSTSSKNKLVIDLNGSTDIATVTNSDKLDASRLSATVEGMNVKWTQATSTWSIDSSTVGGYPYATVKEDTTTTTTPKSVIIDLDGEDFSTKGDGTNYDTAVVNQIQTYTAAKGNVYYDDSSSKWVFTKGTFSSAYPDAIVKSTSTKTSLILDLGNAATKLNTSAAAGTGETAFSGIILGAGVTRSALLEVPDTKITWSGTAWKMDAIQNYPNAAIKTASSSVNTLVIDLDTTNTSTTDTITFQFNTATPPSTNESFTFGISNYDSDSNSLREPRMTSSTATFNMLSTEKVDYMKIMNSNAGIAIEVTTAGKVKFSDTEKHENSDIIIAPNNATLFGSDYTLDIDIDGTANTVKIMNTNSSDITMTLDSSVTRANNDCVAFNVYGHSSTGGATGKVEIITEPSFTLNGDLSTLIKSTSIDSAVGLEFSWNGTSWEETALAHNSGHTLSVVYSGAQILSTSTSNKLKINFNGDKQSDGTTLAEQLVIDLPQAMTTGETIKFDCVPSGMVGYENASIATADNGKTINVYLNQDDETNKLDPNIIYKLNSTGTVTNGDKFQFTIDPSNSGTATPTNYTNAKVSSYVIESKEYVKIDLDGTGRNDDVIFEFDINAQGGSGIGYVAESSSKTDIINSYMNFDISGSTAWKTLSTNDDGYFEIPVDFLGGAAGSTKSSIALDLGGQYSTSKVWSTTERTTTQYGSSFATTYLEVDGYGVGEYESVSISSDGTVVGKYSNGQNTPLFKIPVARFLNPNGLSKEGSNLYVATIESGAALFNTAGSNGSGSIVSNSIENSNVDIAEEFITMITTQRGFQANSKIVTAADTMMETVLNMKR